METGPYNLWPREFCSISTAADTGLPGFQGREQRPQLSMGGMSLSHFKSSMWRDSVAAVLENVISHTVSPSYESAALTCFPAPLSCCFAGILVYFSRTYSLVCFRCWEYLLPICSLSDSFIVISFLK